MADPSDDRQVLAESALLRALVDRLPAMLAYWDASLRCRFASRDYERWFGVKPEAILGRHIRDLLGPTLYGLNLPYIEAALRGEVQEFEREIPDPAGGPPRYSQATYVPDVVDGVVRGFCVLVVDITRRKRAEDALLAMERRLVASERVSAMGTLAAGLAHEINNPLATVLANLDLALDHLARGGDVASTKDELVDARDAAVRVREIVKSMRLFSRRDATERAPVDVNKTVAQSVRFALNTLRYRARVAVDLRDVGTVEGNAPELSQVLVNLLTNAAQSFAGDRPEANEIRVSTRREGDSVVIEVGDNGCGIPEELQSRIFEPFFTTKDVGVGMGLGLSIANGIVTGLGGTLSVHSKVGEGSVFRIVLPASPPSAPSPARAPGRSDTPPRSPDARRPRILVVDDEPLIRTTLTRALAREGEVTTVGRGEEAIALLTAEPSRFDLVLCDLMMPGLTGADVYAEVTNARPELASRFVFMTGGAFTRKSEAFLTSVQAPVLAKPFDMQRLLAVVRGVTPGTDRETD